MKIKQCGPNSTSWYISSSVEGQPCRDKEYAHSREIYHWLETTFGPLHAAASSKIWGFHSYNFSTALGLTGFTWTVYFYNDAAASTFLLRWS